MPNFNQNKGKRGEREVLKMFVATMQSVERAHGLAGDSERVKRNTMQSDRGGDDLHGLPLVSVEVKRAETLQLSSWWQQCEKAARDHPKPVLPVLFFRQSRQQWRVMTYAAITDKASVARFYVLSTMSGHDFMQAYAELYRLELLERQGGDYAGER